MLIMLSTLDGNISIHEDTPAPDGRSFKITSVFPVVADGEPHICGTFEQVETVWGTVRKIDDAVVEAEKAAAALLEKLPCSDRIQ